MHSAAYSDARILDLVARWMSETSLKNDRKEPLMKVESP